MTTEEQITFKKGLQDLMHTLGDRENIQLQVINRFATAEDYNSHIDDLASENIKTKASKQIMKISQNYTNDFVKLVNSNPTPFREYFVIIPVVIGNKPNLKIIDKYILTLERKAKNIQQILHDNNIGIKQLKNIDLSRFLENNVNNSVI
jgi:hypothetical protein